MNERYQPAEIEAQWRKVWADQATFHVEDVPGEELDKTYVLEMFPYPSGSLHMGNLRCYIIGDVMARFLRMRGKTVMHPMGFDSLGLPAENAAIKDGIAPAIRTEQNIISAREQMRNMGMSIDWDREIATHRPEYYRWNQWFFVRALKAGLIYQKRASVNWCPKDETVLANEQVVNGCCDRCGTEVLTRDIPVWAFKITDSADDLLDGLDGLNWPDRIISAQRHWIGKSHGAQIDFGVEDRDDKLTAFTTRIDTILGCTYVVLAPEHPLVAGLTRDEQRADVEAFVARMRKTDKIARTDDKAEKEGVFTGSYAQNPFTGERIPIWIANFVLADYGTGAVMSVPAHDLRDFAFAKKYDLPIRTVIMPTADETLDLQTMQAAYPDDGVMARVEQMQGPALPEAAQGLAADCADKSSAEGRAYLIAYGQGKGFAKGTVQYHLRDWNFSRQRYWGTPIPVVYCDQCGTVPVPEDQLPVELPDFDKIELKMTGTAPLSAVEEFVHTTCPKCGAAAKRDVETMDTFIDSAWYFARFLSPGFDQAPVDKKAADAWLPVDIYVGGPEHAVGHLIYFRFFTRLMKKLGLIDVEEPVRRLITQGIVYNQAKRCPEHGWLFPGDLNAEGKCKVCGAEPVLSTEKMSKSKGNAVSPDALVERYGADTARVFLLFAGPPQKDLEWNDKGVDGAYRFLSRVWRLFVAAEERTRGVQAADSMQNLQGADVKARQAVHRCLHKVGSDIEGPLHYNTAIAAIMELVNTLFSFAMHEEKTQLSPAVEREAMEVLSRVLAPFAPHLCESLHQVLRGEGLVSLASWPQVDKEALKQDELRYAIQVQGKLRGEVTVPADADKAVVEAAARAEESVTRHLEGKQVVKVVFVPKRLMNFVVR